MSLDLNLLRAFLSIYEHRSVTRAAAELSLTQPTVSHALGRLRRQLRDPLFVRGPAGFEPTARAHELALVFRRAVTSIDGAVEATRSFDPTASRRTFRLCLSDLGELTLLPRIMSLLAAESPASSIEVVPMQISRLEHWLTHGEVDGAIASVPLTASGHRRVVHRERYVCLLPETLAPEGPGIDWEDFLRFRHAVIDPAAGHEQADQRLKALGVERDIALRVHHFSVLPSIVAGCGLAAIVPLKAAEALVGPWPLTVRELPFEIAEFDVTLYWDQGISGSGAAAWFLDLVGRALDDSGDHSPIAPQASV